MLKFVIDDIIINVIVIIIIIFFLLVIFNFIFQSTYLPVYLDIKTHPEFLTEDIQQLLLFVKPFILIVRLLLLVGR